MPKLEWAFVLQIAIGLVILLLMLILLHKINRVKIQMDNIIKEVQSYVDYITQENENTKEIEEPGVIKKELQSKSTEKKEVAQNHLIQSVLREYFP